MAPGPQYLQVRSACVGDDRKNGRCDTCPNTKTVAYVVRAAAQIGELGCTYSGTHPGTGDQRGRVVLRDCLIALRLQGRAQIGEFALLIVDLGDGTVDVQRCRLYAFRNLPAKAEFRERSRAVAGPIALQLGEVLEARRQVQNARRLLKLGDVGLLKRNRFELITTTDDLGLHTQSRDIGGAADYQYISSEGASINFDVSGAAPTAVGPIAHSAAAKVSVIFARANAVVFLATGCKTVSIERHDILGRTILERFKAGGWDKEYVVITELVTASSATILISATDSA